MLLQSYGWLVNRKPLLQQLNEKEMMDFFFGQSIEVLYAVSQGSAFSAQETTTSGCWAFRLPVWCISLSVEHIDFLAYSIRQLNNLTQGVALAAECDFFSHCWLMSLLAGAHCSSEKGTQGTSGCSHHDPGTVWWYLSVTQHSKSLVEEKMQLSCHQPASGSSLRREVMHQ